jgi:hypothetical protein
MVKKKRYYLSSLDSSLFEGLRECLFKRLIHFDTGKEAFIAVLDPPVQVQKNGTWAVIKDVILTARHEGYGLNPITYFPCYVYVAYLTDGDLSAMDEIKAKYLSVIGIAELYRTESDARDHVFDKQQ